MTFLDFFAGIGGFRRGLELCGHTCLGFCEFDKYAVMSYVAMHCATDEQRDYLAAMDFRKRQKEILKDEYRNGEWYAADVRRVDTATMPRADCWCFGFPCQDISVAGKQAGLAGNRSGLFYAVTSLIRQLPEEDRPRILFIENVKNLLSINRGYDFLRVLIELDEIGYDAEWQVLNSKDFGVPQNRERAFIIGHLRGGCAAEVFPVQGTDGENSIHQIGQCNSERTNPNQYRVYDADGISPTLNKMDGGGREPCVTQFCDMNYKGVNKRSGEVSGVAIPCLTPGRAEKRQNGRRFKENGDEMFTLTGQDRHGVGISTEAIGRVRTGLSDAFQRGIYPGEARSLLADEHNAAVALKIKEATKQGYAEAHEGDGINLSMPNSQTRRGRVGESQVNTLDTQCNQGTMVRVNDDTEVYAVWSDKYQCHIAIRKLTPRECWRLQGWTDDCFDKAQLVNSDSQLYKQAGNGVTVNVIQAIGGKLK